MLSLRLKPLERCENFKRFDLIDGPLADSRSKLVQKIVRLDDRAFGPAVLNHHLFDVLAGDRFEGLRRQELGANLLLALLQRWISSPCDGLPRLVGGLARILEADVWIVSD